MRRIARATAVPLVAASVWSCAHGVAMAPPSDPDPQLSRCQVHASQDDPLVVEWPATMRSRLESEASQNLVVVSYAHCEMRVLDDCDASGSGSYKFERTSVQTDGFEMHDAEELWAKLPIGAASLEGALKNAGSLKLSYTVVGQYSSPTLDVENVHLHGNCEGATHLVRGYAVGSFALSKGASAGTSAGVSVMGAGVGAAQVESRSVLRSGGKQDACQQTSQSTPPDECRMPLQLFLVALAPAPASPPTAPKPATASSGLPEGQQWTGVYYNSDMGYLHMVEVGGKLRGRYEWSDRSKWGEIVGDATGNVATYEFTEYQVGTTPPVRSNHGHGRWKYTLDTEGVGIINGEYETDMGATYAAPWFARKQASKQPNIGSIPFDDRPQGASSQ